MLSKETLGAWIIHHGKKVALDANGAAEFPAIDESAKAATLLTRLGERDQVDLSMEEVRAIAVASGVNPRHELNGLLGVLKQKRLIDTSGNAVSVLGVTTRGAVVHAAGIFEDADPGSYEKASVTLAEIASTTPVRRSEALEQIGDTHRLSTEDATDFLHRAQEIGFVDVEGQGADSLLFNGNLFRRDSVTKASRILESLSHQDQSLVQQVASLLNSRGCIIIGDVERILSKPLLEKLIAAGLYDLNKVSNAQGNHVYVTSPAAFHKFVDPMVDDCFDLAKSLVAALTYGKNSRSSSTGRIENLPVLLGKLVAGREIGPATAIAEDYRVLEINRVVKLRQSPGNERMFFMRLLKPEVGQLALQVLTSGTAAEGAADALLSAPMISYEGPESARRAVRKAQTPMSKKSTRDILEAVRGGRRLG